MRNEPDQDMRDCIIGFDQRYGRFEDLNQSLSNVIIGYILISAYMLSLNDFRRKGNVLHCRVSKVKSHVILLGVMIIPVVDLNEYFKYNYKCYGSTTFFN